MTTFLNASCSALLRRASSASSHRHSAIFCRSNRPRLIDTWSTSAQTPPRLTWISEPGWHIDSSAIGQRHHGADTRGRHQAPAYLVLPDDSQQPAVQDDDLLAQRPPDDEQRLHQYRQVGDILDKLLDAGLEPHLANHSDLEAEVAQSTSQIVLDGNRLRLQKLAMGQQHSQLLTAQRLHMHRTVQSHPDHLSDATRVVAVGLVDLRLQTRPHVPRLDTDHR